MKEYCRRLPCKYYSKKNWRAIGQEERTILLSRHFNEKQIAEFAQHLTDSQRIIAVFLEQLQNNFSVNLRHQAVSLCIQADNSDPK